MPSDDWHWFDDFPPPSEEPPPPPPNSVPVVAWTCPLCLRSFGLGSNDQINSSMLNRHAGFHEANLLAGIAALLIDEAMFS